MDDQRTAPGAPPAPGAALQSLRRSRGNSVISGVCGGLGRHYDLDPVIFRVTLSLLAVAGGVGLIAYGFAWLLIPRDGEDENEARRLLSGRVDVPALTALLCALVGCGLLLSMLGSPTVFFFDVMVSCALVGAAHWSQRRRLAEQEGAVNAATAHAVAEAPPETLAPPAPGAPSWWRGPITKDGTSGTTGTGYLWGPADAPLDQKDPSPARTYRRWIGGWIFLLAVAACTVGILVSWDSQPLGTSLQAGLAAAVAVFGLGLAIASCYGRAGAGTLVMALLTCLLLAGAAAMPKSVTSDWDRTDWRPASAAVVRPDYALGTGAGTLDLTGLDLGKEQTVTTRASVGVGHLKVVVPRDATVRLDVEVGVGDLRLPDERRDDIDVSAGLRRDVTLPPEDGREPHGTLDLELDTGVGQVEVTRATS
ncbi:PspC domain-containing protein [Streptomyces sp. KR80]|uniref:PspC domain-containing protein n=1 Tax=Streptomyces sp. KR80 TaxID=3457426 RepID=UPI003FD5946F